MHRITRSKPLRLIIALALVMTMILGLSAGPVAAAPGIYHGTRPRRFVRQCVWSYRSIYRPHGYGRLRSLKCAVRSHVMPIVTRWQEQQEARSA